MSEIRRYALDTNVIMRDPYILNKYSDCEVVISDIVLQELDNHKKGFTEEARNSRVFTKLLNELYKTDYMTENNVKVIIDADTNRIDNNDDKIILSAKKYNAVMVSNDGSVLNKSRALGLEAELYDEDNKSVNEIYSGVVEYYIDDEYIDRLYNEKFLSIDIIKEIIIYPHMFILFKSFYSKKSVISKINHNMTRLELVAPDLDPVWGITARNARQRMALRLLLDPDIPLVTINGKAGTGKTLLALAAGLVSTVEEPIYDKGMILTTPNVPIGNDVGYLPGGLDDKLGPYMQSFYDNLEVLLGENIDLEQLKIKVDAVTFMRGRSIPGVYIIVDEAQNLTRHQVKTLITRLGEGSKIILMGDPEQIDAPHLDSMNNGLTHVINKFKEQPLAAHISFEKGERSKLAEIAADIL